MKALAVGLWVLAWFAVSVATAAAWAACRGRVSRGQAGSLSLTALIAAAVLAYAGAVAW